jgi:hypothetical protein
VTSSFSPGFTPSGLASTHATANPIVPAALDVKPGSCPNPFNPHGLGVFAAAVLGTEAFDAGQIDIGSVRLEGVTPYRSLYQDRGRPGQCGTAAADGELDLVLHFDTQQVTAALRSQGLPLTAGARLPLRIEGRMTDGRLFGAEDVVTIVPGKGGR